MIAVAPAGAEEEPLLQRHRVFVQRAREVSHQSLFFLGLLFDTTSRGGQAAVDEYRPFAIEQVRLLVESVPVPGVRHPRGDRLHELWHGLAATLRRSGRIDAELREGFQRFLEESRTGGRTGWFPGVSNFFRKNLALIWGLLILAAVTWKVEPVNALLRNELSYNPEGFLLPLALLLAPLAAARIRAFRLSRRNPPMVPSWDLAMPAFRGFRFQALEPARPIDRWPRAGRMRREIVRGQAAKLSFYTLWWLAAFALTWWLHENVHDASGSSLTVFMVLSLCYAVLIGARTVDLWDFLNPRPVRSLLLWIALAGFFFLFLGLGYLFFIAAFLAGAALLFFAWSRDRGNPLRLGLALLLLALAAASALGWRVDRKATWREQGRQQGKEPAWSRLTADEWPWPGTDPVVVLAASGGGSRAAVYTGLTLRRLNQEFPQIAERLHAISSVSGGSLANAAYVARLLDLGERRHDRAARLGALADLDEAVARDFVFPTIVGAVLPGITRGQTIEATWEEKEVALGKHRLSELAEGWRRNPASPLPPFPIPVFNSTTLDGHDLVISPLARKLYASNGMEEEARDRQRSVYRRTPLDATDPQTWVYYRDGIYALEDLLPGFDPRLAQAVRASANFPFGFPVVQIRTDRPLFFDPKDSEGTEKLVELTDGGALSNSGMWSLYSLLMPDEPSQREALRRRGVLLLVVAAGKMPIYPDLKQTLNSLRSTIGDHGPTDQRLHRLMFDALGREYGDRIAIVQMDLVSRESYNVLTSWALDNDSLRTLGAAFDRRWREERPALARAWDVLTKKVPGDGKPFVSTRRPPLD